MPRTSPPGQRNARQGSTRNNRAVNCAESMTDTDRLTAPEPKHPELTLSSYSLAEPPFESSFGGGGLALPEAAEFRTEAPEELAQGGSGRPPEPPPVALQLIRPPGVEVHARQFLRERLTLLWVVKPPRQPELGLPDRELVAQACLVVLHGEPARAACQPRRRSASMRSAVISAQLERSRSGAAQSRSPSSSSVEAMPRLANWYWPYPWSLTQTVAVERKWAQNLRKKYAGPSLGRVQVATAADWSGVQNPPFPPKLWPVGRQRSRDRVAQTVIPARVREMSQEVLAHRPPAR